MRHRVPPAISEWDRLRDIVERKAGARDMLRLAAIAKMRGDFGECERWCVRVVKHFPKEKSGWLALATIQRERHRLAHFRQTLASCAAADITDPVLELLEIEALIIENRQPEAVGMAERILATREDPAIQAVLTDMTCDRGVWRWIPTWLRGRHQSLTTVSKSPVETSGPDRDGGSRATPHPSRSSTVVHTGHMSPLAPLLGLSSCRAAIQYRMDGQILTQAGLRDDVADAVIAYTGQVDRMAVDLMRAAGCGHMVGWHTVVPPKMGQLIAVHGRSSNILIISDYHAAKDTQKLTLVAQGILNPLRKGT